ncbi:MAG TPA: PHP domain-containing protein [Dehalococcoidia bacterium]|nr:PHP domain-containing protein [Dehalococcoidia bacterium]
MSIGDFHLHTTASDGVHSPADIVAMAARRGVRHISITDHDSTEGLDEAAAAAEEAGLQLVPGVELSADLGLADVHLLGFGFRTNSRALQEFLAWLRNGRLERTRKTVRILAEHDMPIEIDRVFEIAGEATVGRPHVALALVERGHVASVQEAFDRVLGNGKPADVNREKLPPEGAIRMVHDSGGVVFAAHPVFIADDYDPALAELSRWGLDGIETFYKNYDAETVSHHSELANRHGLGTSGGSDYHGLGNPDDREIGDIPFPDTEVEKFLAFLENRGVITEIAGGSDA